MQFNTMMMMVAGGLLLGALFDVFRISSNQIKISRRVIPLIDLLYWLFATILVFNMLYYSNFGQMRVFIFIGLFMGAGMYWILFRSFFVKVLNILFHVLYRFIHVMGKLGQLFIVKPILILYKLFLIIGGFLLSIAMFLYKYVLQWVYHQLVKMGNLILKRKK